MVRRGLLISLSPRYITIVIIILAAALLIVLGCEADDDQKHNYPSRCGELNISYPFQLKGDDPLPGGGYELSCENNRTVIYSYPLENKYYVEAISYENQTMTVVDSGLDINDCSSLPLYSFTSARYLTCKNDTDPFCYLFWVGKGEYIAAFLSSEKPITSKSPNLLNTSPCVNASSSGYHSYVVVGDLYTSDVPDSCTIATMLPIRYLDDDDEEDAGRQNRSFSEIHHELAMGFELSWFHIESCGSCHKTGGYCYPSVDRSKNCMVVCHNTVNTCKTTFNSSSQFYIVRLASYFFCIFSIVFPALVPALQYLLRVTVYIIMARIPLGILCLFILMICKMRRRHFSMDANIEEFLQEHNNLMLLQYSYSDIKKMTKHFRNKLGRGGFGSVYEGKLRSGNLVAVKMLENSKGNGQDFINEVATIGRIHHVNVVQLIGFCFQGSKRALVYDFMPNGSLDKYIFIQEQTYISLSWENMYKIALGVAHGIEYLHQGCDMQILHFDIKPHNILLNEDFTPKVSDFGLAKLYPTNDNTVPLTGARGTIGYIAPELVYKSMGGVSYKADVYSFGMLLMEMAGRRKNVNPYANTSSQTYFPSWIYEKLNRGEDMEMEDATEEEKQIVRKIIIVALSCIQLKPADRPSMSGVIEMLESPTELLQMPPRPFLGSSFERVEEDHTVIEPSTTSLGSTSSSNYSSVIHSN